MKDVIELFKKCSEIIALEHGTADASEQLRAAVGLVDLSLRQECELFNQKRWEDSQKMQAVGNK